MNTIVTEKDIAVKDVYFNSLSFDPNPTVEGRFYPPTELIPAIDEVAYPVLNEEGTEVVDYENRIIRYIPGEKTIFAEEQSTNWDPSDREAMKRVEPIIMREGLLIVDPKESLLIKYLRASNFNASNPHRMPRKTPIFKERDEEMDATEFLKSEQQELDIRSTVMKMDVESLEAIAVALRMPNARNKKTAELRRDVLIVAKHDPARFMATMQNPKMKRMYHVLCAIDEGVIVLDKKNNIIKWPTGTPIIAPEVGVSAVDALVDHTFTEDGRELYDTIQRRREPNPDIESDDSGEQNKLVPGYVPEEYGDETVYDDNYYENLYNKAVDYGVIVKRENSEWHTIEEYEGKINGKKNVIETLKESEELRKDVESMLQGSPE